VLDLLAEHRAATAEQVARIWFPSEKRAADRLRQLFEADYLARWRPYLRPGSAPLIYTIGPRGAALLAAAADAPAPRPSDTTEKVFRLQHSPSLGHTLGVVELFTLLHAAARALPGAALTEWWSEDETAGECFGIVRPDGYGRWVEDTATGRRREVWFLFEYDRGTEKLDTLLGKIDKYARLMTEHPETDLPVLIEVPNHTREANLHRRLNARKTRPGQRRVYVATTHTGYIAAAGHNPAGAVWWPAGTTATRHRLINLGASHDHTAGMTR
jgi:protein involved in plasmid replication-relaxation